MPRKTLIAAVAGVAVVLVGLTVAVAAVDPFAPATPTASAMPGPVSPEDCPLSPGVEPADRFDLVLVGGGMVGAALGCAVALEGLRVALVEGRPPQRTWPVGEVDLRVSALSRAFQLILGRLGAWDRMAALGASPYREMRVWEAPGSAGIHFDSAQLGEPDLGHIVGNRVTQLALWERLEALEGLTLCCPDRLARLTLGVDAVEVSLASGAVLRAALVVGADGRDSRVRAEAGIGTLGWAYDQLAIVANVRTERWHQETAWQRLISFFTDSTCPPTAPGRAS